MAKVDCSEFAQAVNDLAMIVAAQDGIRTLDDVVAEIQKSFPVMPREEIVNAIVDANTWEQQRKDSLQKRLEEIKRNAKMERATREKIATAEALLAGGKLPPKPKPRKMASETLRQARKTLANLRKWLATADPAMRKTLQEKLDALNRRIESGDVVTDEKRVGEFHKALQGLAKQVKEAQRMVADAKTLAAIQARIDELQGHLDAGTLPEAKARSSRGTGLVDTLRNIRDDLKKQLAQSEPAQKARIQKQIAALEERIAEGDFAPRPKLPEPPQSKQLERLAYERDQLRKKIRQATNDLKPKSIWYRLADPFNAIRALKTSFDFSAVFRQGGFIVFGHPIRGARALPDMFRAAFSPRQAAQIEREILSRPNAPLYAKTKLYLAPTDGSGTLAQKEEAFMSRIAEKIPGVAASQRAYVTFLNKLRADSFDAMAATLARGAEPTLAEAQAIAGFINEATGRGSLGKAEGYGVGLNTVFFAPKYVASRFQLLVGHPLWGGTGQTRKLIAAEYARYLTGMAVVYVLGWLAGGDPEEDPRSSDFGKIRFGDSRLDPLSGISQTAVLVSRLATGQTKSSITGKVSPIRGPGVPYGGATAPDVLARFLRGKLSPTLGIPLDVIAGENVVGEPTSLAGVSVGQVLPMQFDDIYKALREQNVPTGAALSMLSIFGMGLQTYGPGLDELVAMRDRNLYKADGPTRRGEKVVGYHRAGQPHAGQEDLVRGLNQRIEEMLFALTPVEREEFQRHYETIQTEKLVERVAKDYAEATESEILAAIADNTYALVRAGAGGVRPARPSINSATGRPNIPGAPYAGQEAKVEALRAEYRRRTGRDVTPGDIARAQAQRSLTDRRQRLQQRTGTQR